MPVRSPSALASSAVFLEQAGVVSSSVLRRRIGIGGQDGCVFLSGANPGTPRIHPSTRATVRSTGGNNGLRNSGRVPLRSASRIHAAAE